MKRMNLTAVRRDVDPEPDRIFVYGVEKIGKTTFGACAPSPIFISAERGLAQINPVPAHYPEAETFQDVLDAIEDLTVSPHSYRTLVVDSMDWIAYLVQEAVCKRQGWTAEKFAAYGKGFEVAMADWQQMRIRIDRLQKDRGMEVILIAHAEAKNFDDPTGPAYVRYQPKMGGKVAPAFWKEWAKAILFARQEYVVKEGEGFAKGKGSATGRRILHTAWEAAFDAGTRYEMPPVIDLDYNVYALERCRSRVAEAKELLAAWAPDEEIKAKAVAAIESNASDPIGIAKVIAGLKARMKETA